MCHHENQLNKYLAQEDANEAKDAAIELLAEQMIATATATVRETLNVSTYNFTMTDIIGVTSHNDEFNEVFYKAAEKLINSLG